MRPLTIPLLFVSLLLAASAPGQNLGEALDASLRRARAEQAVAEVQVARLEQAASLARDEASRLRAQQAAAAQAIEAAEARITAADAEYRLVSAMLRARRQRLAGEQQPIASLLTGLAVMAQRPPLLSLADRGGTDEFVKVRILLDATLPTVRTRTAALSGEVRRGEQIERAAAAARLELAHSRQALLARRQRFAMLERRATNAALQAGGQALTVGDVALAAGENVEEFRRSETNSRGMRMIAAQLASAPPAPARPAAPESASTPVPFHYELPASAPVIDGLGSINESGVRSRGLTFATSRGAEVTAPATGIVRFSGPFRDYDGVLIIEHGGGWMSLLLDVSSTLRPGTRVGLGEPIGRALGPLGVELSQNGHRISPALIAGSSPSLSKPGKGR